MKKICKTPFAEKVRFRYAGQIPASSATTNPSDSIRDYLMAAILGDCSSCSCNSLMSIFG